MAFDDLRPQPPIHPPEAEEYARRAVALSREAAARCDTVMDVPYGDDYYQRVDIYRPALAPGERAPVLVFAHGGGWTNGYKEWMGLLGPAVTAFPAVLVSVSHRHPPEHRWPVPFEDCLAALAWVHAHIADHGGDPDRLFVGGHSSGGHLYALATLRRDALAAAGVPPAAVRACLPVSSRFDMVFDDPQPGTLEHRHQSVLFSEGQDTTLASPYHQTRGLRGLTPGQTKGNRVPFLLTYGERDLPSIIDNNTRMARALEAAGSPVRLLVLGDHDHFDTALEIRHATSPWTATARAWMTEDAMHHE